MNNFLPWLTLLILIPTFLPTIFIPYWTRRTESFGVTIPSQEFNNYRIKRLRKKYTLATGIFSVAITVLFLFLTIGATDVFITNVLTGTILVYLAISFIIYLYFHQQVKKLKEEENWRAETSQNIVVSTSFRKENLIYSNLWFLIAFFLTIGLIFYTLTNYHLLPEQIPMQYNFFGEVTNWAEKSYRSALMLPVMQLFLTLLFLFVNMTIERAKQQIDPENPEDSVLRNAIFRRRWSLFLVFTGNGVIALLTFIQLSFFYTISPTAIMLVSLLFTLSILIYAIYLSYSTGQGGSRIRQLGVATDGGTINRDEDQYWILGIFYFNRQDPALFLEKRFGVGWTINIARPLAWIIFLGIIGLAILIPLYLR